MKQSVFSKGFCSILLFSALANNSAMASEPVKQYALRDFFGKPERSFFRLSDDGKTLGFMQPYERRQNLYVVTLRNVSMTLRHVPCEFREAFIRSQPSWVD